jgi:hypothetical protein
MLNWRAPTVKLLEGKGSDPPTPIDGTGRKKE